MRRDLLVFLLMLGVLVVLATAVLADKSEVEILAKDEFSLPDEAVADPHAATATRRSQLEWEMQMRQRMPKAALRRTSNDDGNDDQDEEDQNDDSVSPRWFDQQRYQAVNRFGRTVDQSGSDPSSVFPESALTNLVFSCEDLFSTVALESALDLNNGNLNHFNFNACTSAMHCVKCAKLQLNRRTASSGLLLNQSQSIVSALALLKKTRNVCPVPSNTAKKTKRRSSNNNNIAQQAETLRELIRDTLIPAVQAVADWVSGEFGRCPKDAMMMQLVSVSLRAPTRTLLLQADAAEKKLEEEQEQQEQQQQQQQRKKKKQQQRRRHSNWQLPALVVDAAQSSQGVNRHLVVGEVQRARVEFLLRDGTKRFVVDVDTFLHPELRSPVAAAGPFRPAAVLSLLPVSISLVNDNNFPQPTIKTFSFLSWNLWHTQARWLAHRSAGVARIIKQLSPNAVAMQEMRLDNTATMFLEQSALWHSDVEKRRRSATCDVGGRTAAFDHNSYIRHSISMVEHLHRRVRSRIPYFVDTLPAMVYPQDRYRPANVDYYYHQRNSVVLPVGMFQWQAEGLGLMHKHVVLGTRKLLLPRQEHPPLPSDEHQRALLCHALLVKMEILREQQQQQQQKKCTRDDAPGTCQGGDSLPQQPITSRAREELIRIDVCTSHFSLNKIGRLNNARDAVAAMESFAAEPLKWQQQHNTAAEQQKFNATATIFAGDLNAEPDDDAYKFLLKEGNFSDLHEIFAKAASAAKLKPCPASAWSESRAGGGACLQKVAPTHCTCWQGVRGETFDRRFTRGGIKRIDFMLLRNWDKNGGGGGGGGLVLEPTGFRHLDGDFGVQPPLSDHVGLLGDFVLKAA